MPLPAKIILLLLSFITFYMSRYLAQHRNTTILGMWFPQNHPTLRRAVVLCAVILGISGLGVFIFTLLNITLVAVLFTIIAAITCSFLSFLGYFFMNR